MNPLSLRKRISQDNATIRSIAVQLIDAVHYLHTLGIAHRDIKPENLFWTKEGKLLVGDFGLATEVRWSEDLGSGTSFYASPEAVGISRYEAGRMSTEQYPDAAGEDVSCAHEGDVRVEETHYLYDTFKSDIWSIGIVLINLVCERNPWQYALPSDEAFSAYMEDPEHFLVEILPAVSPECHALLKGVLRVQPEERMTLKEMKVAVQGIEKFTLPEETGGRAGQDGSFEARAGSWIDMDRNDSIIPEFKNEELWSNKSNALEAEMKKFELQEQEDSGFYQPILPYRFPPPASAPQPCTVSVQLSLSSSTQESAFSDYLVTPGSDLGDPMDQPMSISSSKKAVPLPPTGHLLTPTYVVSPSASPYSPLRQAQNAFLENHYNRFGRRGSLPLCVEQMAEYQERVRHRVR